MAGGALAVAVGVPAQAQAEPGVTYGNQPGDVSVNVVGGDPAPEGAYPYIVRLSMGCGGAMITEQVVLTAAHCVDGTGQDTSITASTGSVDLNSPNIVKTQSAYVHAGPGVGPGDWALIKLAKPVANAKTIKMAETADGDKGEFQIMGWGADREGGQQQTKLRHAKVPFVDDGTCAGAYSDLVKDSEICAGLMDQGGVDTCQGDSGGPMVQLAGDVPTVVGIVSWGEGCARPGKPGVYGQVSFLHAEIKKALDGLP
ncbi:S1 family peptidase [Herbihabitans rhizosphaerae]|uniref:S1 family peptidase n=1 Tax=Herbihabitans rhizosphaerae TaxID=1872711 RepID=UPI001F5EEE59|nr:serine protease [Herbihabitans rhizosphaerae]